jgi:hypothetical protein
MDEEIIALVAVTLLFGGPLVAFVSARALRCAENVIRAAVETRLKLQMIERGYSVQEIERLCATSIPRDFFASAASPVGPAKPIKA